MKTFSLLFAALFLFGCSTHGPTHKNETPQKSAKQPGRIKNKTDVEERPVCGSLKKWENGGWFNACEIQMEGGEFDSTALAICDKIAPYFETPDDPLRCLNQIKSTDYNKAEYDEAALSVCSRLAQWEKTKYDAIWCLGVVKNKKYSATTIKKCLKLAKPGKQPRKSLYMLDVEGTKI